MNTFSTSSDALHITLDFHDDPDYASLPSEADATHAKYVTIKQTTHNRQLQLHLQTREEWEVHSNALFRVASLMNHSCTPNVAISIPRLSAKARWVAVKHIRPGDELFECYLPPLDDLLADREKRRNMLFQRYKFWCDCELCKSGK